MRAYSPTVRWRMSTSDSDSSIDYLASDSEDNDNDSGVGLSPDGHTADSTRTPPSSSLPPPSSPSSLRDSPSNTDCDSSKDGVPGLNRDSNHEDPHRLSSDSGDFGDSGLSRDGDSDNSNQADPRLNRDRDSSDGSSSCGSTPPATYEVDRWPSETQGYSWPSEASETQGYSWPSEASEAQGYSWPSEASEAQGYSWPSEASETQGYSWPSEASETQGYSWPSEASETQGHRPTVYGKQQQQQQRQRQSWSPTSSSQAWDSSSRQSGTGKSGQGRKRAHSPGWQPGDHYEDCRNRDTPKPGEPEKDQLFTQKVKCMELQNYLHPLSSILRGLSSGRYSERLSSIQESVAMDRIQRIMGVLQNPNMGERYVSVILKMEEMLHSWFPQVRARRDSDPHPAPDQHIDSQEDHSTPAKRRKQYHAPAHPPPPVSPPVSSPPEGDHHPALQASDGPLPGSFPYSSATHLKCIHTAPICSSKTETAQQEPPGLGRPSTACPLGSNHPADYEGQTQDDAVSSSTDPQGTTMDPHLQTHPHRARPRTHRGGPPSGKISSPCLERLLRSKESIIVPRNTGGDSHGGGGESSWS